MKTAFWFATPIYSNDLYPDELAVVSDEIDRALGASKESFQALGREPGLSTTFRPEGPNNFIAERGLHHTAEQILKHTQAFCIDLGIDRYQSLKIESSWVDILGPEGFQFAHNHSPSMVSGIYYHQSSREDGTLIFESPNIYFTTYEFPNNAAQCTKNLEFRPKKGRILLFPSWLTHFVDVNRSRDDQISLSFNLKLSKRPSPA